MQQITLTKIHPNIQLGHLYEHLFCTQVKKLFYNHGLFKYLDYYLSGTVHEKGGIIEIEIEFYTAEALALVSQIPDLKISVDPADISTAFTQLLAEEEVVIETNGLDSVTATLIELQTKPWQDMDDFGILDTKSIRHTSMPIYINENKLLPSRRLEIRLHLDADFAANHRRLLPLFLQIAKIITFTAQDILASENGYYPGDVVFQSKKHTVYMKADLQVAHANDQFIELSEDLDQCKKMLAYIDTTNSLQRLVRELHTTSYAYNPHTSPNIKAILNETDIYIGSRGWHEIATRDNINLLLSHASIELVFGRKKDIARLVK